MKVIGESKEGYIIEAHKDEIARLIGYYGEYALREKGKRVSVGDEINVNAMYMQLYYLEKNQPKLKEIVKTLRNLADLLEPVCPVIEEQIKEAVKPET